mmetsp:Transcript_22360/g.48935  ORF Transcript_22360/g.48935 Transcript_22360/m.48935 type:complete len:289 (+) Transcript_22360:1212-2078(+)
MKRRPVREAKARTSPSFSSTAAPGRTRLLFTKVPFRVDKSSNWWPTRWLNTTQWRPVTAESLTTKSQEAARPMVSSPAAGSAVCSPERQSFKNHCCCCAAAAAAVVVLLFFLFFFGALLLGTVGCASSSSSSSDSWRSMLSLISLARLKAFTAANFARTRGITLAFTEESLLVTELLADMRADIPASWEAFEVQLKALFNTDREPSSFDPVDRQLKPFLIIPEGLDLGSSSFVALESQLNPRRNADVLDLTSSLSLSLSWEAEDFQLLPAALRNAAARSFASASANDS